MMRYHNSKKNGKMKKYSKNNDYGEMNHKMDNSGQISSDHNEFANMPQDVKHFAYPKADYSGPMGYRDNLEGIDDYSRENYMIVKKQERSPGDPG